MEEGESGTVCRWLQPFETDEQGCDAFYARANSDSQQSMPELPHLLRPNSRAGSVAACGRQQQPARSSPAFPPHYQADAEAAHGLQRVQRLHAQHARMKAQVGYSYQCAPSSWLPFHLHSRLSSPKQQPAAFHLSLPRSAPSIKQRLSTLLDRPLSQAVGGGTACGWCVGDTMAGTAARDADRAICMALPTPSHRISHAVRHW